MSFSIQAPSIYEDWINPGGRGAPVHLHVVLEALRRQGDHG